MEKFLNDLIEFILPMNDIFLYIFLFFSAIIENLFPPIPGDTITILAAFLVGIKRLNYFWVYFSTTLGSVFGFMLLFSAGKFFGRKFFDGKNYKHFSIEKIQKTENWIRKYGYWIIFANRFMPGVRSVISIVSGISELKTIFVFIISFISASIWNLIWIQTGFILGNRWEVVKEKFSVIMRNYNLAAVIVIISAIVILIIINKLRNKIIKKTSDQN